MTMEKVVEVLKSDPDKIWSIGEVAEKLNYPRERTTVNLARASLKYREVERVLIPRKSERGKTVGYRFKNALI